MFEKNNVRSEDRRPKTEDRRPATVTVHPSKRLFRLTSIADPAVSLEPPQTSLIFYVATRNGEVLLRVRCCGAHPVGDRRDRQVASGEARWRAVRPGGER